MSALLPKRVPVGLRRLQIASQRLLAAADIRVTVPGFLSVVVTNVLATLQRRFPSAACGSESDLESGLRGNGDEDDEDGGRITSEYEW